MHNSQKSRLFEDVLLLHIINDAWGIHDRFNKIQSKQEKILFIKNEYLKWHNEKVNLLYELFSENDNIINFKNTQTEFSDDKEFTEALKNQIGVIHQLLSLTPLDPRRISAYTGITLLNHNGVIPRDGFICENRHLAEEAKLRNQENKFFRKCMNLDIKEIPWSIYAPKRYEIICVNNSFSRTNISQISQGAIDNRIGCPPNCHFFTSKTKKIKEKVLNFFSSLPKLAWNGFKQLPEKVQYFVAVVLVMILCYYLLPSGIQELIVHVLPPTKL